MDKDDIDALPVTVTAALSLPDLRVGTLYRLDFKLRSDQIRCQRAFILKETSSNDPPFRTPISHSTSSDEVYHLARQWISKCRCHDPSVSSFYPPRLVSLAELKKQDYFHSQSLESTNHVTDTEVRLVETSDWEYGRPETDVRYVTLSHCWGKVISDEHNLAKLTSTNMDTFKQGIKLRTLPKTFRHAIEFAARLPHVGFIWIDSLCIKQDDTDDWLQQSSRMDKIYEKSFLNISATAASNSGEGLFATRRPELLLEDEVILNIAWLPGAYQPSRSLTLPPSPKTERSVVHTHQISRLSTKLFRVFWMLSRLLRFLHFFKLFKWRGNREIAQPQNPSTAEPDLKPIKRQATFFGDDEESAEAGSEAKRKTLRRCTILNPNFWTDRVEGAPVNKRGWVLQERLMAPRVLHFCKDQVAWECREFEAAEGQPEGIPNFQLSTEGIREGSRLKALDVMADGSWLRRTRLQDYDDPDPHLRPGIYALELWRRIVEVYSKTSVTKAEDKLIALSGIARWMSRRVEKSALQALVHYGNPTDPKSTYRTARSSYVAGLWTIHLASQLLWSTEPVFREIDSSFRHVTTAPDSYRAPSFSWASLDTEEGNGIKYAEVTDQDLFITVEEISITPRSGSDEFGILEDAHLILWGQLRKATLLHKPNGRFGWRLVGRGDLDEEEHTIVYLDSPIRDAETIIGDDAGIFIVPAAKVERTSSEESKYLVCLILQLETSREKKPAFRRVGLTKLSPYGDHKAMDNLRILDVYDSDVAMPHQGYDSKTGMHRILLY